jgi:hypothetical protein
MGKIGKRGVIMTGWGSIKGDDVVLPSFPLSVLILTTHYSPQKKNPSSLYKEGSIPTGFRSKIFKFQKNHTKISYF